LLVFKDEDFECLRNAEAVVQLSWEDHCTVESVGRSLHGRVGDILNRTGSTGLLAPSHIQVHTRVKHMFRMTC
jgi:hypothetical protein